MSKDLPPPVTRKSSKKKLWEELECVRAEVEQQQVILSDWRDRNARLEIEADSLRYQMSIVRAVLAADVKGPR